MPSWSIHLAVAKRVNKILKADNDNFYYGNLLPDVDYSSKINRYNAHYYNDNLYFENCPKESKIDIKNFLKDYQPNINNPLILGYYTHLLTDDFYNNVVYNKCWIQDSNNDIIGIKLNNNKIIKVDKDDKLRLKRKYKHKDFELYGKYLYNNEELMICLEKEKILPNIKFIKNNFLNEELVDKRIEYLYTAFKKFNKLSLKEKIFKHKYTLFTKKELDLLLNDCVNYIINKMKKEGIINE